MLQHRSTRPGIRVVLAITLTLAVIGGAAAAQFVPPTRRAGWWEQSFTMNMGGKEHTMTTQMCTDPEIEKQYSVFSQTMSARNCSRRDVTPVPGGWRVDSECSGPDGAHTTSGMVTGDFQSHLHMDFVTHSARGADHVVMDMRWVGACPAGRRPGDMVMPGGQVMNMSGMMAH
jgi:hypothetical protein